MKFLKNKIFTLERRKKKKTVEEEGTKSLWVTIESYHKHSAWHLIDAQKHYVYIIFTYKNTAKPREYW